MGTILVEVESRGLLTGVALGGGVRIIAPDAKQLTAVGAAKLNLNPAVALTQDAGCRLPLRALGYGTLGHGIPSGCTRGVSLPALSGRAQVDLEGPSRRLLMHHVVHGVCNSFGSNEEGVRSTRESLARPGNID